jgi:hypothetical protein
MKKHIACWAASLALLTHVTPAYAAQEVKATRFGQNPLITVDTSSSLGGNVNGPTVIRVPDWVDRPLGRYSNRVRHVGLFLRGSRLHVFFTAIGDAPERVLVSTIDVTRTGRHGARLHRLKCCSPKRATNVRT